MVSPVSNGMPQQIPASNTFQPGGSTDNVRQREDREDPRLARTDTTAQTAESRSTSRTEETRSNTVQASSRDEDNGQTSARTTRGSVLDVVV